MQRYYRIKAHQAVQTVLEAIAPGNSSWLLQQVFTKQQSGRPVSAASKEESLVSRLVTLYNEANSWYTQQQILSLFAGDYFKTELLQLVPGLTKFRIDANLHPSVRRVHPELVCGSFNNRKHFSNAESSKARSQPGAPKVRQRWMFPLRLPPAVTPRHQ